MKQCNKRFTPGAKLRSSNEAVLLRFIGGFLPVGQESLGILLLRAEVAHRIEI